MKVPTWLPFRLQIYFNQHQWLARQLTRKGIPFKMLDNVFVQMSDWKRAQRLANGFSLRALHRKLNELAGRFCPVAMRFARGYRLHGLIRRIGRTYKYYVTQLGQKLLIAALKLKEHLIIPELQPTSYASLSS